jgi:hypothetical protein
METQERKGSTSMNTRLKKKSLSLLCAVAVSALLMITLPQRAAADDDDPPGRVARLNYLHGSVSFQPAGEDEWVSAVHNRPMTTGDKLWVDKDARAELHIGSAAIRLGETTGFSFLNLTDRTVQIRLTGGTLAIHVRRLDEAETFEVDTPNLAFSILRSGTYRISTNEDGNSTVISVRGGEGEVTGRDRAFTVHSGQMAIFNGTNTLESAIQGLRKEDEFDEWCRGRDRREERAESARYVSRDVIGYEDLDEYGSWRETPGYGVVWVPSAVVVGWSPYHYGHWAWVSPWGWTWVDDAPWGFAPFHYGRWVFVGGYWGWVPGPVAVRAVYAPALVAFVGGRHFSLAIGFGGGVGVGWFPLGPREVYVPSYRVSQTYVQNVNTSNTTVNNTYVTNVYNNQTNIRNTNINNTDVRVSNIQYVNQSVPGAVTAVPQSAFTGAQSVSAAAVHIDAKQIAREQVNNTAPVVPIRASVMGTHVPAAADAGDVAKPPTIATERAVVAKTAPPPPPVPFDKQQHDLAAHPGHPLARNEVEDLRSASDPTVHSIVRPVISVQPAKATTNDVSTPASSGKSGQAVNAAPTNTGNNQPASAPVNPNVWTAPAGKRESERDDRPASARENNQPSSAQQPAVGHSAQTSNTRPTKAGSNEPENEPVNRNVTDRPIDRPQVRHDDRPPSANTGHPSSSSTDGVRQSNELNIEHANKPPAAREDRPASANTGHPSSSSADGVRQSNESNIEHANKPPAAREDRPASANTGRPINSPASNADDMKPANSKRSNVAPGYNAGTAPAEKPRAMRDDRPPSEGSSGHPETPAPSNQGTRKPANTSDGNVNNNPPPAATRTTYNPQNARPAPGAQVDHAPSKPQQEQRLQPKQAERDNREEKKEEKKAEKPH